MHRIAPWAILGVFTLYLGVSAFAPDRTPDGVRIGEFASLPVVMNGRIQPIDSIARAGLRRIRGTSAGMSGGAPAWQFWKAPRRLEGSEWLLEVLTKPDAADARKIFPIHDSTLIAKMHLKAPSGGSAGYYSYAELRPGLGMLGPEATRINAVDAGKRAAWESECLALRNAVVLYDRFKNTLQPNSALQNDARGKPLGYDLSAQIAQYQRDLHAEFAAVQAMKDGKPQDRDTAREQRMDAFARPFLVVSRAAMFSIVPRAAQGRERNPWQNMGDSVSASMRSGQVAPSAAMFAGMSAAFARGDAGAFNDQVAKYQRWLTQRRLTPELSHARDELFFNAFQPFAKTLTIYLVAVLLLCASRLSGSPVLSRTAVNLIALAWLVHTAGLLLVITLEGRLPLTNGYGRILMIGWVAVLLAGAAEVKWRNALGATVAAVMGLLTLAVAQSLAPGGVAEWIRVGAQAGPWLTAVVIALLAAACLTLVSRRSRSTDNAVSLRTAGTAVGSVA
jgi:hypothetical protein